MKEIKVLPKKYYKQVYGEDYDSKTWSLRFEDLSDSEKRSIKPILDNFKDIEEIFSVPAVDRPEKKRTPDLLIDGIRVEIKEIKKKNSPEDQTQKAVGQVGKDGWVIFDVSGNILGRKEYLRQLKYRSEYYGLKHFAIVEEGKILDLVFTDKKNQRHHRALLGKKPNSGNDITDFYTSILSQKQEKVNIISPKVRGNSAEYWRSRSLKRTTESEKLAMPYLKRLREEYRNSSNRAIDNVRRIYENYFSEGGFDKQKLREIVPSGEFSKFLKEVRNLGVELPDNYAFRVSREEFAQAQLWLEMQKLGVFENQLNTELYSKIIENSMKRTFGDYGVSFSGINKATMNRILAAEFHGGNYSTRIWGRTDRLANELPAKLAVAIGKGQSWEKTSREIRERFGVSQSSAERLVRTETNHFENLAEIETYAELGVEEFEFLAELDGRTSEICRHHHGKKYKVEKAKAGENVPPLHPNCRSTIVAIIPEFENKKVEAVEEPEKVPVKLVKRPAKQIEDPENVELSLSKDLSKKLSKEESAKVLNVLEKSPQNARIAWAKFADEIKVGNTSTSREYYRGGKVVLNLKEAFNPTREARKPLEVFFHEFGHGIDSRANRSLYRGITAEVALSNGKTLGRTIFQEAQARVEAHEGVTRVRKRNALADEIRGELNNGYIKKDLFSIFDLYGGAVYNDSRFLGAGHSREYWDGPKTVMGMRVSGAAIQGHREKMLGSEGFAEMFSSVVRRDKKEIELFEKYLPESFKMFNELLERISKNEL